MDAIIICSRFNSSRLPGKIFRKINGVPFIEHLVSRIPRDLQCFIAVPYGEISRYLHIQREFENVKLFSGDSDDCLMRMADCARIKKIDRVVRITHDKCFLDYSLIREALLMREHDYVTTINSIPGTQFEVISAKLLEEASFKYKNVEHISYAVKSLAKNPKVIDCKYTGDDVRLLLDYPEDESLFELIFQKLGNDCTLKDVVNYIKGNHWVSSINKLPKVSVYTCVYNSSKYIAQAMESVFQQSIFKDCEYIIVDDYSTDQSLEIIAMLSQKHPNVRWLRNDKNQGLAYSSNVALCEAKGKYIVRLDADDWFPLSYSLDLLVREIERTGKDAIYPDNYFGSFQQTQSGDENHHIGGAIFNTKAVNAVKFNPDLRHYEGLDFFKRAKDQLDIGYFKTPVFFYRQHDESLSRSNLKERENIRNEILTRGWSEIPGARPDRLKVSR